VERPKIFQNKGEYWGLALESDPQYMKSRGLLENVLAMKKDHTASISKTQKK